MLEKKKVRRGKGKSRISFKEVAGEKGMARNRGVTIKNTDQCIDKHCFTLNLKGF